LFESSGILLILELAMLLSGIGWLILSLIAYLDQRFYPPLLPEREISPPFPRVTIIIPARNEERNIEGCLRSVLSQEYPELEILVVDDESTDRTPEIVESYARKDPRLKLIRGAPIPPGWVGKGWALYQGHLKAEGEYLILLDADTRLYPHAVTTLVAYNRKNPVDLLNPIPRFVQKTFWEKVLGPLLWGMVRIRFPWIWVNQRWIPDNMAFGPLLFIRKEVYDAVGGHRLVAHDILEDVALSRLLKERGFLTRIVSGKYLFEIRMYHSLREIIEGWTKTAYGAMGYNPVLMAMAILGSFFLATQPFLTLILSLFLGDSARVWLGLSLFQLLGLCIRRILDARENEYPLWTILFHPVGMVLIHSMQLSSVWRYYFGSFRWKGRIYRRPGKPTSTPSPPKELDVV
jgi:chlorobactene glucosyltransferase